MAGAYHHLGIALEGNHWLEPLNFEPTVFCRFQKAVELPLFLSAEPRAEGANEVKVL